MNSSQGSSSAQTVQEYSIRVPKNSRKTFHVMRFNSAQNIDFSKWTQVKMERENNIKQFKMNDEEQPKFGAGSEYGREAREEARRKKYGIITKKYKPEDQPWILKIGGMIGKKFKGIREGGVSENASYYVFTHGADGNIEAYPLTEWYNFQPIHRYKALSAEEAEQEFGRRNKVMNYFSLMLKKRLKNEDDDGDEGEEKPRKGRKSNDFKISEMDDWIDDDDDDDLSSDEGGEEKSEKKDKAKKKTKAVSKKKKRKGSDESAVEESDDGDEEGRELDYISDSSESASDHEAKVVKELKGVAEESALRRLLTSDEDEDEEDEKKKEEDKKVENGEGANEKDSKDSKKRKRKKKPVDKKKGDESSSDSSSSDSETDKNTKEQASASSQTSTPDKKETANPAKKPRTEPPLLSYGGESGITEEAVRRYLMRKPMTATELFQKFKGRKTGLSSEQLVNVLTQILKKINPVKQKSRNKMYLSIKPQ